MTHPTKSGTRPLGATGGSTAAWVSVTIQGTRVCAITAPARERIIALLADHQLVPAPAASSRGGPTFVLRPWAPGGMSAQDVVASARDSGLMVIATFGIGLFGTVSHPPADQRIALVSPRQLALARPDSGWVVLAAPALEPREAARERPA